MTPSDMGEACSLSIKHRSGNNIMIDMRDLDDVDYFVVMA
jgi:hypothetical protein